MWSPQTASPLLPLFRQQRLLLSISSVWSNDCSIPKGHNTHTPHSFEMSKLNEKIPYISLSLSCRFGSGSSQASQNSGDICRICHCESDPQNPLLTPCYCSGSLKYVHQACLQQWLTASATNSCELCKFPFIMHTKIKPFNEVSIIYLTIYPSVLPAN